MSAERVVRTALIAALRGDAGLGNGGLAGAGVFAGPPVKATPPYAEVGELLGIDWSVKDRAGRELRLGVTIRDAGETSARIETLTAAAQGAIEALPRALDGWDVASLVLVRTRLAGTAPGRWSATIDYRLRVLARG